MGRGKFLQIHVPLGAKRRGTWFDFAHQPKVTERSRSTKGVKEDGNVRELLQSPKEYDMSVEQQFFRPKQASVFLGIGLSTFWKYVKEGKITILKPTKKTTIVSRDELIRFAHRNSKGV